MIGASSAYMQTPLHLTFRGLDRTDALDAYVRRHVDKLSTFHDRIASCRVAVESPHHHTHNGRQYRIRVDVRVPGHEVVVSRAPDATPSTTDAYASIDRAFDEAGRRLQECLRRDRGQVKPHEHNPHGHVTKLYAYEGYGFIEDATGTDVYFHRNAVRDGGFERLHIGSRVRYVEEIGEKGPQASTVVVI